jgi:prepilin-type N-terminal cleavage/methylation domain-containing protein/prepilin-type processing-associated H-X9-DG protein
MRGRTAFTLIELLVVISIIALLISILIPALRAARELASGSVCLSNQKSLALAWYQYQVDNDGKLVGGMVGPAGSPWYCWVERPQTESGDDTGSNPDCSLNDRLRGIRRGLLYPYTKHVNVYHCPGDRRLAKPTQKAFRSYSVAAGMNGEERYYGNEITKYDQITMPVEKYVFVEEADPRGWNIGSWMVNLTGDYWIDPLAIWHNRRSTLSFADGHAEMHDWQDSRTIEMSQNQQFFAHHPGNPDLKYMQQRYVTRQNP